MGGSDSNPGDPRGYSTQLGGNYENGYHADGYSVVIKPDQLTQSINQFKSALTKQNPEQLSNTLLNALIESSAFGSLPNAESAYAELQKFVTAHANAMSEMGISLSDFVARVQAAADLGYQADPVTREEAARQAKLGRLAE
jgi:hypothetical protein